MPSIASCRCCGGGHGRSSLMLAASKVTWMTPWIFPSIISTAGPVGVLFLSRRMRTPPNRKYQNHLVAQVYHGHDENFHL